jgi:hypothetical protein
MKKQWHGAGMAVGLLALAGAAPAEPAAGALSFEVSVQGDTRAYAPHHVAAIWIETPDGTFVRLLRLDGRKYHTRLRAWQTLKKNGIDGATGATLTAWGRLAAGWDGGDANGRAMPDGEYVLKVEVTWRDAPGPSTTVRFRKGAAAYRAAPPDAAPFRDLRLAWTPAP